MVELSIDDARQIVDNFVKQHRKVDRVEISIVERKSGCWIVMGTSPINLEGHPWVEKFKIVLDQKGKIKSAAFTLL